MSNYEMRYIEKEMLDPIKKAEFKNFIKKHKKDIRKFFKKIKYPKFRVLNYTDVHKHNGSGSGTFSGTFKFKEGENFDLNEIKEFLRQSVTRSYGHSADVTVTSFDYPERRKDIR